MCPCAQPDSGLTDPPKWRLSPPVSIPLVPSHVPAPVVPPQPSKPHCQRKKHGRGHKDGSPVGNASKCSIASLSHNRSGEKSHIDMAAPLPKKPLMEHNSKHHHEPPGLPPATATNLLISPPAPLMPPDPSGLSHPVLCTLSCLSPLLSTAEPMLPYAGSTQRPVPWPSSGSHIQWMNLSCSSSSLFRPPRTAGPAFARSHPWLSGLLSQPLLLPCVILQPRSS